jgi:hypothetical protein
VLPPTLDSTTGTTAPSTRNAATASRNTLTARREMWIVMTSSPMAGLSSPTPSRRNAFSRQLLLGLRRPTDEPGVSDLRCGSPDPVAVGAVQSRRDGSDPGSISDSRSTASGAARGLSSASRKDQ